jgi:hypothetical protein
MTSQENQDLHTFLISFGAAELGEGDLATGANLLAAMACSIANIQRPGSGYVDKSGTTYLVGSSLIISGSHSSSLVNEKIIQPMGLKQSSLASHISYSAQEIAEARRNEAKVSKGRDPFMAAVGVKLSLQSLYGPQMAVVDHSSEMAALLETEAPKGLGALARSSHVFISGNSPGEVQEMLLRSHLKRPVVHVGIDDVTSFENYRNVCLDVIDGRGSSIQGMVFITDPCQVLSKVTQVDGAVAGLVQRMMWLVDGNAGPLPADHEFDKPPVVIDALFIRYRRVMSYAWGKRLTTDSPKTLTTEVDFSEMQTEWMKFLKGHEPSHPGLSGAARTFLVSLCFGFSQLENEFKFPEGYRKFFGYNCMALAKFLVLRMINARSAMLADGEVTRRQHVQMRVLGKLTQKPFVERDIYRHLNLTASACRETLIELEQAGKVVRDGHLWAAVGSPDKVGLPPLTLEA